MDPIESSLHVGETRSQSANDVGIRSCAETDAIHYAGEPNVWLRQHINVSPHPRRNVLQSAFSEISDGPPGPCIDKGKHLLTYVRVGAFRDCEISYARIERRVDSAVIEIVTRSFHCRYTSAPLVDEWLEGCHRMFGLFMSR